MAEFRLSTLGEVVEETGGRFQTGPFGTVLSASEYTPSGVPVISVGEVGYGRLKVDAETPKVDGSLTARLPEYVLHSGDIVFARKGAVDRVAWVTPEQDGWFLGSDGIMVRVGEAVNAQFLAYQLQSQRARRWLLQHAAGSTMASLNQRVLSALPVAIPGLPTQDAIADVLGALDDKIAANSGLVNTSDQLATALMRSEIRASDGTVALAEVADVTMGSSPPGTSYNEERIGTVFYQGVRDFGIRFPTNRVWTTAPVRMAAAGDVLVSVRAPVGRVNLAAEETCVGRGLAGVRSRTSTPYVLFHALRGASRAWAPYESEGTVFGSINRRQLESLELPRLTEEVAELLEARLRTLELRTASALEENATLAATRDALLPGLMSGKLRVKDAERVAESLT